MMPDDMPRTALAKEFTLKALEKFPLPSDPEEAGREIAKLFCTIFACIPKHGHEIKVPEASDRKG